jgi:ParB family chromosome partitioning protein
MSKTPSRLGRGLNALIRKPAPVAEPEKSVSRETTPVSDNVSRETVKAPPVGTAVATAPPSPFREIPVGEIEPNPNQPRSEFTVSRLEELAASIRSKGVLQPVVVRAKKTGGFTLVAGERRWRAAQAAGLSTIPAIVRELSDADSVEIALIENLQREDLTPLERATAYQRYLESFRSTADELAARLGESRANVSNYLRLLRLPEEVRELLRIGELGMGQARAIAGISDPRKQLALARLAVRRNLSVRQVEALVKNAQEGRDAVPAVAPSAASRHADELAGRFSRALGLPVRLVPGRKKNSGRIVIQYANLEDFDRVCEKLGIPPQEPV